MESVYLASDVLYILTCDVSANALVEPILGKQPVVCGRPVFMVLFVTKVFSGIVVFLDVADVEDLFSLSSA